MTTRRKRLERVARWGLAGVGFAVLASPVMVWAIVADPPTWVVTSAAVALASGVVCWVVATILDARAERVSVLRLVGRTLWAPIRFLINFTF